MVDPALDRGGGAPLLAAHAGAYRGPAARGDPGISPARRPFLLVLAAGRLFALLRERSFFMGDGYLVGELGDAASGSAPSTASTTSCTLRSVTCRRRAGRSSPPSRSTARPPSWPGCWRWPCTGPDPPPLLGTVAQGRGLRPPLPHRAGGPLFRVRRELHVPLPLHHGLSHHRAPRPGGTAPLWVAALFYGLALAFHLTAVASGAALLFLALRAPVRPAPRRWLEACLPPAAAFASPWPSTWPRGTTPSGSTRSSSRARTRTPSGFRSPGGADSSPPISGRISSTSS